MEKENSLLLRQTFFEVIFTDLYPKSEITIFIKVIEEDGNVLAAAVNAGTIALIDAGIGLKDFLVCCSSSTLENTVICDANYVEQIAGGSQLTVAIMPNMEKKIAMIKTRESNKKSTSIEEFEKMLEVSVNGCMKIYKLLKSKLKDYSKKVFKKRILS